MTQAYKSYCLARRSQICCHCLRQNAAWSKTKPFLTKTPCALWRRGCSNSASKPCFNPLNIQMLSQRLHEQIFKADKRRKKVMISDEDIQRSIEHLKEHGLWDKEGDLLQDVHLKLPKLFGRNIDEHFQVLAMKQSNEYMKLSETLAFGSLPAMPEEWVFRKGWTMYDKTGDKKEVDYPLEEAIVFDVECLMTELDGQVPTLAVAASTEAWYSWCSERLIEERLALSPRITPTDLIPLETTSASCKAPEQSGWQERLVVGHNVSFDRSYIKEQYLLKGTKTRFLDTLSLHMAVSGLTTYQRALWNANKSGKGQGTQYLAKKAAKKSSGPISTAWLGKSSPNNLADVYALYSQDDERLDKSQRDTFVSGTMEEVRDNFQELTTYCAKDVEATHVVFTHLLPKFFERFQHPVTFAAMLEMGQAYLPVNQNWDRYLQESQETYDVLQQEMKLALMHLANDACQLMEDESYKDDPWLWELDWSTEDYKLKKEVTRKKSRRKAVNSDAEESCLSKASQDSIKVGTCSTSGEGKKDDGGIKEVTHDNFKMEAGEDGVPMEVSQEGINDEAGRDEEAEEERREREERDARVKEVLETSVRMPKVRQHMVGYPMWYRELCPRKLNEEWAPGPSLISSQVRVAPKLLRLTWEGYPLHYEIKHGWGYLVPGREEEEEEESGEDDQGAKFPLNTLKKLMQLQTTQDSVDSSPVADSPAGDIQCNVESNCNDKNSEEENLSDGNNEKTKITSLGPMHQGQAPRADVRIPGCWFYRLPHKDGTSNKVGNPLAKDFFNKLEDGTLRSAGGAQATRILELNKLISSWRNSNKRICSQMVVDLDKSHLPRSVTRHPDYDEDSICGAIIPRVITAGTVTRRAVEPTWLTASNARMDRVGSELKAMVQAPPGYHFVGADVDSQELWIAALLGDANFAGCHGCTAFGWMTLQGKKSNGTDMHSITASTVGISREHAKVINYGRIYGAGRPFAVRLLMQFNHRMSLEEAQEKANKMYAATKGVRRFHLEDKAASFLIAHKILNESDDRFVSSSRLKEIGKHLKPGKRRLLTDSKIWTGGSESDMFNQLESIAHSKHPKTPVLNASISRALEPETVKNEFITSRINWVVQSSAVDYLHLMLVCMRWLFEQYGIDGRFCISIHDEVRYLVTSEDRYRAALALQITNLLTRSMFAYKVGMNDLPQSVAFFSAVDIDTVLRKEVTMDCQTPSNPYGLQRGYGIPTGEAFDIYEILEKTNNGSLAKSNSSTSSNSATSGNSSTGSKSNSSTDSSSQYYQQEQ